MMKKLFTAAFIALMIISCHRDNQPHAPAIRIVATQALEQPVRIYQQGSSVSQQFQPLPGETELFTPDISQRTVYLAEIPGKSFKAVFSLGPEEVIELTISDEAISGYTVSGSKESEMLASFNSALQKAEQKMHRLMQEAYKSSKEGDFAQTRENAIKTMEATRNTLQLTGKELVSNNPGTLAAAVILEQSFGGRKLFPTQQYDELYKNVINRLEDNYPANTYAQQFLSRAKATLQEINERKQAKERASEGNKAQDIVVSDTENHRVSLSEKLVQTTLLVFWSMEDEQSAGMLRELERLLMKHENLTIFTVSLHTNTGLWEKTNPELPRWIHATEPMGLHASSAKVYGIEKTPLFILIEKDGTIVLRSHQYEKVADHLDAR